MRSSTPQTCRMIWSSAWPRLCKLWQAHLWERQLRPSWTWRSFFSFFFVFKIQYTFLLLYSMSSEWIRSSDWSLRDLGFASSIDLFMMGCDGLHRAHLCCVYPWQPFWWAQGVSCLCWGRGAVRGQRKRSCFDEIASGQWLWDGVSVAVFGCVWHVEFGIIFSLFHLGLRGFHLDGICHTVELVFIWCSVNVNEENFLQSRWFSPAQPQWVEHGLRWGVGCWPSPCYGAAVCCRLSLVSLVRKRRKVHLPNPRMDRLKRNKRWTGKNWPTRSSKSVLLLNRGSQSLCGLYTFLSFLYNNIICCIFNSAVFRLSHPHWCGLDSGTLLGQLL